MSQRKLYIPQDLQGVSRGRPPRSFHWVLDGVKTRLLVVCCAFILTFLVIIGRLFEVSLLRGGGRNFGHTKALQASFRGDIVDRHGELLATSLRTSSVYA